MTNCLPCVNFHHNLSVVLPATHSVSVDSAITNLAHLIWWKLKGGDSAKRQVCHQEYRRLDRRFERLDHLENRHPPTCSVGATCRTVSFPVAQLFGKTGAAVMWQRCQRADMSGLSWMYEDSGKRILRTCCVMVWVLSKLLG